ncbi:MAG: TraC family protein [Clostridiales bacterium]|nr:TraC family protein [Clostridiales bacterium]MCF8022695.1 TraC family protein [Clostridiales bacterium]
MFFNILLLLGGAGAVFYLFRPRKKMDTVQELLDYKNISPDGVIELPHDKFRVVMEVEPVNMALQSFNEQSAIWLGFKNMLNSVNIPLTFLVQTRYLNLKDYLNMLKRYNSESPEHIQRLVGQHVNYLAEKTEGRQVRDRRYFIILKVDASSIGVGSGIDIDNQLVNMLVKKLPDVNKSKISSQEIKNSARDELNEACSLLASNLDNMGINCTQLNKKGVADMLYQTFNRDMAPFARMEEADSNEMFSLFVKSQTPGAAVSQIEGEDKKIV